ncbi:MAG: ribosome maturation factor RimM [Bifidobacteriaceae bacterium]|jgi:16S rRNA processing protein RimM|nr:ribosome maturation factor RimM [Bifidobacteriaceae bacterium]
MEVVLAVVGRPRGVRGDVHLELRTDRPDRRFQIGSVYVVEASRGATAPARLTLSRFQAGPRGAVGGFVEAADRTAAEALRGVKLLAQVEPDEEADAWYVSQLRGATVVLPDGSLVGTVKGFVALPAQDLLEIEQPDGVTALVPLVKELVPEVDPVRRRVVIDPPAGLVAARPVDQE